MIYAVVILGTVACGILNASLVEWLLHKFLMHRPLWILRYPFEAHAQTHHRLFRADASYHCRDKTLEHKIPMTWWNGPVIVLLGSIPLYLSALPFVLTGLTACAWIVVGVGLLVSTSYYGTYEYLHWCMHLPKARQLEKSALFQRLNGHHILHHRYPSKNFNVVLPLADILFRTFLRRSKYVFAQVRGPSVPDVQPLRA